MVRKYNSYLDLPKEFFELNYECSSRYTIHQSKLFMSALQKHFYSNGSFHLATENQNQIESVLNFYIEKRPLFRIWKYRTLKAFGGQVNDFYTNLCIIGSEKEAATKLCKWFMDNPDEWESIHLEYIPLDELLLNSFSELMSKNFEVEKSYEREYFFINTDRPWEVYFTAEINKKLRDVRGRINRIRKDGHEVFVEYVRTGIENYIDDFLFHYSFRREQKSEKNSYADSRKESLLREVLKNDKEGIFQLALLKDEKNSIWAYQLDMIDQHNGIWFHYAPCFLEKYKEYSPGKVLLLLSLQEAFRRPDIKEFNFMRGESRYKQQFTSMSGKYLHLKIVNPYSWKIKLNRKLANLLGRKPL